MLTDKQKNALKSRIQSRRSKTIWVQSMFASLGLSMFGTRRGISTSKLIRPRMRTSGHNDSVKFKPLKAIFGLISLNEHLSMNRNKQTWARDVLQVNHVLYDIDYIIRSIFHHMVHMIWKLVCWTQKFIKWKKWFI